MLQIVDLRQAICYRVAIFGGIDSGLMLRVIEAKHLGDYRVFVRFNTGESGVVDLCDALWGEVFEPYRNPKRFATFSVSPVLHTIAWGEDADIAPEYLLEHLT